MTGATMQTQEIIVLECVYYIHYPMQFRKDQRAIIWALVDLGSKVNMITLAYTKQLGLQA